VCSWADEGLLTRWYPRGVSSPKARLAYYAERFDTVEVDSPFYRLPTPETAGRWAERTPRGFVFHAKASKVMTGHEPGDREEAFAAFREALGPLEAAGKLRGVLLQYPPGFVKSGAALDELAAARSRLDPLVPLVEFRHRSWMTEDERADTLEFLERHGLAYVSVDSPGFGRSWFLPRPWTAAQTESQAKPATPEDGTASGAFAAANVLPRLAARTHEVAYIRFHGRNARTWNARTRTSGERFDWLYEEDELAEWVGHLARLEAEGEVYAMFNNNRHDYAPRSAMRLRGLLDEADVPATGGVEPEPRVPTLFDADAR
jgi:uncharacterized protein YecE (DUF72 family)